ncbi:MAG: FG-GAP-like repeat-containing protein [Nostoc sp. DedQUE12a]|nr:FG-GAP-like repeat-containing protein [Nostoc sp. DedQUE12a]
MPNQNIIFIDGAVINYQSLIAGIQAGTSVVILDSNQDGVEQITQALQGGEYQSVQIFSHGSAGSIQLGSTQLNANNLNFYSNQLQQWRNYLTDDADILLYGCNVASSDQSFVQLLSQITGADVAASNDITGSASFGGDWDLEVKIGEIESDLALTPEATMAYRSILPLSFATASNFAVGSSLSSVTVGDFNKDGNLDLAVANSGSNNVSVLLGNGSGGFGAASNFGVANSPLSVIVGDFNKDGNSDLAVANSSSNNVSVLLGNGNGSFGAASNFAVEKTPYSVTVGDFNKDGNSDLAVASIDSGDVSVLLGNGSGGFEAASNFDVGGASLSITVGDFNKDGNSDLAVALVDFTKVSVVLGNGSGSFGTASSFDVGGSPISVTVGDFDKDGNSDLAVALNDLNKVSVLLGNGSGGFGTTSNFDVGSTPSSVTVGDFNKDGNSDLAVANSGSNNVSVLLNTSALPNTAPTLNNTGNPRLSAIAQDITDTNNSGTLISVILARGAGGDPIIDPDAGAVEGIAVIGVDNTNGTWQYSIDDGGNWINFAVSSTSATLLRDTEKIRFVPKPGYKGTAEFTFRAWDTSDGNISGTTNIVPAVGGGTTAYSSVTEIASISVIPSTFDVGLRPYSIVVGDFDKDGKLDLVTANKSSQSVSVLLGKGDGTFKPASTFSTVGFNGLSPSSVAVADFNKDGKLDLVTANSVSNNISLLLGKGDGSFQTAVNFALESASAPIFIAVGDFNKDGKSDVVTVNNASQNISVLLGNGAGSFGTASNFKVPSRPTSVTVADFNKDGISDLAVTSSYFNNVSIMLGDGDGTFNSATQFDVGTNPNSVVVGDFNKDNKLDLAVANSDSNNVSILLGNGAGGYGIATNFDVGLNPVSVTAIDFDNDGNSDLAVTNAGSDTVSVLLGNGNGGFGIATNYGVGTKPYSLTVGDFNKDGKSELAVANSESKNVSLVNAEDETYEPVPPQPILINEILFDPPSTDSPKEYIELRGTPGAILAPGTFLVGIEGDSGSPNPGNVQDIFDLSGKQFGSNGLLVLLQKGNSYAVNPNANVVTNTGTGAGWGNAASSSLGHTGGTTDIESGSVSFFLIQTTTAPNLSNDIDSNNDGIADGAAYSNWTVLDSVSVLDGATTDIAYGSIVFRKGSVGSVPSNATVVDTSFTAAAGYVGRSGNTTGSTASDWVASVVIGTAPNLTLDNVPDTSPQKFAGQPLNHIGDTNFVPPANVNYAISTATPSVTEGNSGTKTVTFTVNRSGNTSIASTVYYVLDGTATFNIDYKNIKVAGVTSAASGAVIFAAGETTKAITLSVVGEKVTEADETINLTLSHPNQTSAIASGTITIDDDDNQPTISIADKSGKEDIGNLVFTVKLSNASTDIITVGYTTANDTAIANVDYTPVTGTLTFNPGVTTQTITVPIVNDFVDEPTNSERFFINLTNPTNATIADNQGIGTITDDDTAGITISPANALVTTEAGGTANFSIQLDSQPTADVTVSLSSSKTSEGTVSVSSVTFTAANWNTPQIITVTGVNDGVADDNIAYQIITAKAVSSDAKYNNLIVDDIDVVNIKNDNQVTSIITGSPSGNNLQGTSSGDLIFGFAGNDIIVGGGGNDRIYGGFGTDNLTGGVGSDIFVIVQGEGRDTIKDFNLNEDLIALSSGISYSNLSITQSNNDTLIKIGTVSLALLTGITASNLNTNHFTTY